MAASELGEMAGMALTAAKAETKHPLEDLEDALLGVPASSRPPDRGTQLS